MIENNYIELGKRAVVCKGWRWMPGMLHGTLVGDELQLRYRMGDLTLYLDADRVPDLTDPATLGCLLALVREAWGQDDMGAFRYKALWCVEFTPAAAKNHAFYGETEAAALVAALEAAP